MTTKEEQIQKNVEEVAFFHVFDSAIIILSSIIESDLRYDYKETKQINLEHRDLQIERAIDYVEETFKKIKERANIL